MLEGPGEAVTVRSSIWKSSDAANLNNTDLVLLLVDAGWEKAEQSYYQGLDEGYVLGYTEGLRCGRSDAERLTEAFRQALDSLERSLLQFYAGLERWTIKLAMHIAEKVVGNAAKEQQEVVRQTVRKAIAETADKSRLLIKVNPSDFEAMKDIRTDVASLSEGIEHFKIEVDANITPGSCKVETPSGLLDADFTTQLRELRRALILQEEAAE